MDRVKEDIAALDVVRRFRGYNRAVGVSSSAYFKKFLPDAVGFRLPYSKSMIVEEDELMAVPHELAHTFGVNYENYLATIEDKIFSGFNANPNGYLGKVKNFKVVGSYSNAFRIHKTDSIESYPWVDDRTYSITLGYLLNPIIDPETVLVTGVIDKKGRVSGLTTYELPNGVVTPSNIYGEIDVRGLDSNGKILSSVKIVADYRIEVIASEANNGVQSIDVDSIPFMVELPRSTSLAQIQVVKGSKQLSKTSIAAAKLSGLVWRIPVESFKGALCWDKKRILEFKEKEKRELQKQAQAIQALIDGGNSLKAKLALEKLILEIKLLTSASYVPKNEEDLSQSTVVSELRKISKSLSSKNSCLKKGR